MIVRRQKTLDRRLFQHSVLAVTPFGADEKLMLEFAKSNAFPVLDAGWVFDEALELCIGRLAKRLGRPFGLRLSAAITLPEDFSKRYGQCISAIIFTSLEEYRRHSSQVAGQQVFCEVVSVEEALEADQLGLQGLIVKGNEAGGRVGELASFVFMQQVAGRLHTPYWVQGGMGPFSALAAVYSGASGVVYDSQFAMMGKWARHARIGAVLKSLNGSETEVCHGYRHVKHGLCQSLQAYDSVSEMLPRLALAEKPVLMAGMDVALASLFAKIYHDPQTLIHLTETALQGRFSQMQANVFQADSAFAQELGITYPLIQGPMTRVSDEPAFAAAVAQAGGLPTIACAVLRTEQLDSILGETSRLLDGKPWAAGLLAFMPPDMLKPQIDVVLKHKPTAVVLAGGRSEQCKQFVEHGIVPLVHCPTANLFQQFLKDGVRHFIFEGRECGGHIGPMSSMTLWEMQINLAMDHTAPESLHLVFAGGIHDSLSAHMVSAMVSPLAERGVRLGLLAGTAYIFCREAVETKAILENFQQQAIAGRKTTVVETGLGHITRCLKTEYVDYLAQERRKMEQQGLSKEEIFVALEQLNVGHLRIATKGVRREGDQLVEVSLETQNREGMFMIGDVALMRHQVTTMPDLHSALSKVAYDAGLLSSAKQRMAQQTPSDQAGCAIAIVGMAARFAGSANIDEYWLNILEGRDLVTEVDDSRWSKALYFDPATRAGENEKSYSKWGAFIDDFAIDPTEFGIPPQTLSAIDAGQLAALRVAKDALVDAGYSDPERLHNTSVIFGYEPGGEISGAYGMRIFMSQIAQEHPDILADARQKFPKLNEDSFAGILGNVLTGRVSNRLNLGGQNFTIDAACASSLAAIDAAVKELRYGESDMVVAGGVDFHNGIQDYIMFCSTYALSHKGKCFSFSAEADGIALGEGMAAVVLKRLEDAEADGDHIYGVIQGIAGSSDGKSLGLTAPRREGQKFALQRAYQRAGVSPQAVGLVEAHGTGTVVGDKTELTALDEVYRWSGAKPGSVGLGTVKSQIGHTKCAAGVASLIKGVLASQYGILPPTLNIETPNPQYKAKTSPFVLNNRAIPWLSEARLAGVSSFGFGGTNYHAVIGNAKADAQPTKQPNLRSHELFCFAAETMQEALVQVRALSTFIEQSTMPLSLAALAWAQFKRSTAEKSAKQPTPVQLAIVVSDMADLQSQLQLALKQQASLGSLYVRQSNQLYSAAQTAFLFAGQGSQFVDMGRELFNYFPSLRQYLSQAGQLRDVWFPPTAFDADAHHAQLAALTQTDVTQPLLGLLGHAIAHWLGDLGIEAQAVAGHSYGELAALAHAGAIPLEELTSLSRARAQAIIDSSHQAGGMLAVACDSVRAQSLLNAADAPALTVANINSPQQTVLTGSRDAVQQGLAFFERARVKCTAINTPYAFHSALIADAEKQFATTLSHASLRSPQSRVWSNLTAQAYADASVDTLVHQLARQIVSPVRYQEMIEDMYANGVRVFIEVGPGAIQTRLVKDILADKSDVVAVATLPGKQNALRTALQALAQLNVAGVACDLSALYAARELPAYDLSQPLRYKPSTWLVNGHYARPLQGDVPAGGFSPVRSQSFKIPATLTHTGTAVATNNGHSREQVMYQYLSTLNHFVDQQKSVMMQYLGAAPAASMPSVTTLLPQPSTSNGKAASEPQTRVLTVAAPSQAASTSPAQATALALKPMSKLEISAQVVAAIALKTGYPAEMIAPQLDLESDLGIDSIKRMELLASLAEELGLQLDSQMNANSQDATELLKQVAGLKSADQIADWMLTIAQSKIGQSPALAQSAVATPVIANTLAGTSVAVFAAQNLEQLTGQVIAAIAEKTGYPEEMITPQLDLESDLGIDSIKRMELLSTLAERLGIPMDRPHTAESSQDATALLKEVASLKSAAQIASWMHSTLHQSLASAPVAVEAADAQPVEVQWPKLAPADTPERRMVRYETHYLPCETQAAAPAQLGQHALVIAEGDVQAFVASLKSVMTSTSTVTLEKLNADALLGKDAVFWVLDHTAHKDTDGQPGIAASIERFEQIFRGFQALNPTTLTSVTVIHLCAVSQTIWQDGCPRSGSRPSSSTFYPEDPVGVAGLVAALRREWPKVNMACVYLSAESEAHQQTAWLKWVQQEQTLQVEEGQAYVYRPALYHAGQRYRRTLVETPVQALSDHALTAEDVLVVVGGAKGITQWTAAKLAQQYGCHLVIIGRSALEESDVEQLNLQTADALRKQMIAQYAGQYPIAEIQTMIARETQRHQLVEGIRELQRYAKSVTYYQADCNQAEQIQTVIRQVSQKFGRISACIYGAGMIRDKFLHDKTMHDARTVYNVKTLGYSNFVQAVMAVAKPRIVIAYSSISAILGSRGQSDYAAANEALEYWNLTLGRHYPGTRFTSVGWGPWTGVGMVDRALEEHLSRYKIYAIARDEGANFLAAELASTASTNTRCFAFKTQSIASL